MILKSYLKCSTCSNVQYDEIFLKTNDYLSEGNPKELSWKCCRCGFLNFIEVKVKQVD